MKLGIMQPYFFPYAGYFELIARTDRWIVFDTAQYIRHGWVNRNRILHPREGWQYITVPLRHHARETSIKDIKICNHTPWRERILGQLAHYKKRAPFFQETITLAEECLAGTENSLSRMNTANLAAVCRHLGIPFRCDLFSEMNLDLGPVEGPGDWALRICQAVGADEYINPPGGESLFDRSKFTSAGIRLTIQDFHPPTYSCAPYAFLPGLSILDVLMWNGAQATQRMLHELAAV